MNSFSETNKTSSNPNGRMEHLEKTEELFFDELSRELKTKESPQAWKIIRNAIELEDKSFMKSALYKKMNGWGSRVDEKCFEQWKYKSRNRNNLEMRKVLDPATRKVNEVESFEIFNEDSRRSPPIKVDILNDNSPSTPSDQIRSRRPHIFEDDVLSSIGSHPNSPKIR